jgi:hypothetical protein
VVKAWLTVGGIVSHETALLLYGVFDDRWFSRRFELGPTHLTVPRSRRKTAPADVVLHTVKQMPASDAYGEITGLPVSTVGHAVIDYMNWAFMCEGDACRDRLQALVRKVLSKNLITLSDLKWIAAQDGRLTRQRWRKVRPPIYGPSRWRDVKD